MAALSDPAHHHEHEERMALFAPVLASMRLESLPALASSIRKREQSDLYLGTSDPSTNSMACIVLSPPLFGSFHILFPLEFVDGARWLLKVPATGHRDRFAEIDARALTSEALTMRLLKRETTIPIPAVYAFDASLDNDLNCPFILMEYISGMPLYDCWFDQSTSEVSMEQRRGRSLQEVAEAMGQLNQFTYSRGGSIVFDRAGEPMSIGPVRKLDVSAMLERRKSDDPNDSAIFCELGPFTDPKSFLLCMLDRRESPTDRYSQGIYMLLRFFIDWIPQFRCTKEPDFVLSHPDLDIQNVLVAEDGRLCGIIDWDGVAAVPRCIGNERYPSWLTRDWDPAKYRYDTGPEVAETGLYENSPEELALYRAQYLQYMGKRLPRRVGNETNLVQLTRNSLMVENLMIAADDPSGTHEILGKIFGEIVEHVPVVTDEPPSDADLNDVHRDEIGGEDDSDLDDGLYLYDIATALADGNLDPKSLARIKAGFATLCS